MSRRTVEAALSWEYWRRGMVWFVPASLGVVLAVLLLSLLIQYGSRGLQVGRYLDGAILPLVFWLPVVLSLASWKALPRHYPLPVTTRRIVRWSLLNGALAAGGMYLVMGLVLNGLLGAAWPLLVPPLLCISVYMAFQAVLWWIGPSQAVFGLLIVILTGLLVAANKLAAVVPGLAIQVDIPTTTAQLTAGHGAVWLGVLAASYLLAVNGVARDRRGGAWSLAWLDHWWGRPGSQALVGQPSDRGRAFRSPRSAQVWLEWRSKGHYIPWTIAGTVGSLWLCFGLLDFTAGQVRETLGGLTGVLFCTAPFLGVYLGSGSGGFDMKSFAGTRPVPDRDLAAAVLRNVAVVLGSSAAVWGLGVLVSMLVWSPGTRDELLAALYRSFHGVGIIQDVLPFVLALTAVWTLLGSGASLGLTRRWFVCCVGCGLPPALLTLFLTLAWSPGEVQGVVLAGVVVAAAGGILFAFGAAWSRGLVSVRVVLACVAGYALLLAWGILCQPPGAMPGSALFVFTCLLTVPFAPFALAPLAAAWNRHR